jgi:large subunit ribosomal protein L25
VRCLPNQIPESIRIDISKLDLGEMLHVEDLIAEASYEFEEDPTVGVVSVMAPESAPPPVEEGPKK